jgi:hypothetical protein
MDDGNSRTSLGGPTNDVEAVHVTKITNARDMKDEIDSKA